jgi:hypothetical protein
MILIGTDEGIYRWFAGAGWPIYHSLQDREVVGLAAPGPGVLVAVDRGGEVRESTDGGLHWTDVPLPAGSGRPTAMTVQGTPPAIVLALRPLSIYRRAVGTPIPAPVVDGNGGRSLGTTLRRQTRRLGAAATSLMSPSRGPRSVDAETARLGGWEPLNPPNAPRSTIGPEVRGLAAAPSEAGPWFAAVPGAGLWRSGDGGRMWEQCPGLPSEVYAVQPVPGRPEELWAATADGCRHSGDAGRTWNDRSEGLGDARQVRAVAVRPDNPKTLLAGAAAPDPTGRRPGLNFALYESSNDGQTWAKVVKRNFPESIEFDAISGICFDPAAPDNIVVALESGELWLTPNAGAYWGPIARQIKAARVLCGVA